MTQVIPITARDTPRDTLDRVIAARKAIRAEYIKRHRHPWIVAFSGGKDSTLLLQLVFDLLLDLPHEDRRREVHIIGNDTLVESPPVIKHLKNSLKKIRLAAIAHNLPVRTVLTMPNIDQTFWVNVIGRGYIPPTRSFRWCTDRLKIRPADKHIKRLIATHKRALLLIGTRKSESTSRRRRMEKRGKGAINSHGTVAGCRTFTPLAELSDDEVWITLLQRPSPWGGHNRDLATLYRNGSGGECPFVLSKDDAPSCGTASPRFGCWTCTVVNKDRSMSGLIDSGFEEYEPLFDFREMLVKMREDPNTRQKERRNGEVKFRNGARVMGPFTLESRKKLFARLRELEKETGWQLISDTEVAIINDIWRRDHIINESRHEVIARMRLSTA